MRSRHSGGTPAEAMEAVAAELAGLPQESFPHLAEASAHLTAMDLDERFNWGLECLLDGLELRLAGPHASAEPGGPRSA